MEKCLEFWFCRGSNQIPYPVWAVSGCGHSDPINGQSKKRNGSFLHLHHIKVRAGSGLHCKEQGSLGGSTEAGDSDAT